MSDDLVKRLKETIEFGIFDAPNPVTFDECLAEIEYLRADLASACAQLREAALAEIAALRAENARLRRFVKDAARQKKTTELETEYDVECADFEGAYDYMIDNARAALGGENDTSS